MEKFDIHILGCGSALPTLRHEASAQVINIREKLYMIDCGEGTQVQLRRSSLKFSRLNHIFISHLHGDHCFGLMGLISTFGLLGRTADLHIYAPDDIETLIRPLLNYFCQGMSYKVITHQVNPKVHATVFEDRSVSVETLPLKHRVPCCGYLFREKPTLPHIKRDMVDFYNIPTYALNNIKEGADWVTPDGEIIANNRLTTPADAPRSYAYCSDTIYRPQLKEWIEGTDLLYHEATFLHETLARAKATFHTTALQAATLAHDAEVKKLCIGHFSARYEDETPLLNEAKTMFTNTILARENLKISL